MKNHGERKKLDPGLDQLWKMKIYQKSWKVVGFYTFTKIMR